LGALTDLPEEYDDLNIFNATLAHKTNNNFPPYINTYFGQLEHPRFGLIVTVTASRFNFIFQNLDLFFPTYFWWGTLGGKGLSEHPRSGLIVTVTASRFNFIFQNLDLFFQTFFGGGPWGGGA
jgi:hypothetical protein